VKYTEPLPIAKLRLDGGTQPRAALNLGAVEDYSKAMSTGAKFPPLTVYYDGEQYWLADGFHRVKAACAAGLDVVECEVRQGTIEEAQWHSFSANKANGLRRTTDDKQRAVKAALLHANGTSLSDCQIARHVGVDQKTVSNWRRQLQASQEIPKMAARSARRKGKTYKQNTSKIGRSCKQKPGPLAADSDLSQAAEAGKAGDMPKTEAPAATASVRTTRSQRVDRLARLTLSFIEATKHLAHLVGWLGETAGAFGEAELLLSSATNSVAAVIAEIERKAVAADPLNASRLEIQENRS
jgi:ParB-like chromosome segregation protein Spo0J